VGTDHYLRRLRRGHDIEVQGEAVYAAAARTSRSPQRKRQWDALRKLETVTKQKLADALAGAGGAAREAPWARWSGQLVGIVAALLPWSATMSVLRRITVHTTKLWERMEREAEGRNAELHAFLIVHERAQYDFAEHELRGESAKSLDSVLALLA
jgi:hypothetical protein